ncbi:MAG TPA: hypothetical protein VMB21_08275 [Candidatus Limnocylindria bacterium]|nr:hypothetical protein [Candidatus Limnocylindria bacterium]
MEPSPPINPQPAPDQPRPRKRGTNVPIPIVVGIICLGLGIAGGLVLAEFVNTRTPAVAGGGEDGGVGEGAPPTMPGGKGGGKAGGGKAGGGKAGGGKAGGKVGPGGGGGGDPNPKFLLTQLIGKVDTLTAKPLTIQLTPEQKKKVQEQITGLDAKVKLSSDEAKAKLDALLDSLKDHKAMLVAAGFFWPGEPGGGGGRGGGPGGKVDPDDNPFKSTANGQHVKALEATLMR